MSYIMFLSTAIKKNVGAQSPMKMPKRSACALSSAVLLFLIFQITMEPTIEIKPSPIKISAVIRIAASDKMSISEAGQRF